MKTFYLDDKDTVYLENRNFAALIEATNTRYNLFHDDANRKIVAQCENKPLKAGELEWKEVTV